MTDGDAGRAAGEAAVGDEGALLAQAQALEVGGRVEHFLHAGAALGALVLDDDDVAFLDLLAEDGLDGFLLGFDDEGLADEVEEGLVDAGGLDDRAVGGDVAVEDGQAAVLRVGVLDGADAAGLRVGVEGLEEVGGREGLGGAHAAGGGEEAVLGLVGGGPATHVPRAQPVLQVVGVDGVDIAVEQACAVELAEQGGDAAGAVYVLDVVGRGVGGDLAQAGHAARDGVDVVEREVDAGLVGDGEDVQDGVGGAAHGHVQAHGVLEGFLGGDGTRQDGVVLIVVVGAAHVDDARAGLGEELLAFDLGGQGGAVTGQGQADGLVEAVHGVRGEHAGAGAAGGARVGFDAGQLVVADGVVDGHDHRVDEVEAVFDDAVDGGAGFHGAAGDEDCGDVQAHGGQEHAGGDLVAVGDAHEGVGAVRVDHGFDAVGDEVAAGQGVEHAVVAHGDAVVDGNRVEFLGDATGCFDGSGDEVAHVLQVHVAGDELGEGVGDGDDRLAEVAVRHAGGAPQGACSGHVAALGGCCRAQRATHDVPFFCLVMTQQ